MRFINYKKERAVSPVIGVLLMLIVTIIIAAVVSGFAGNMVSGQKGAPSLSMDITVTNPGYGVSDTKVEYIVKSVSEPIPTKDLRITTSWMNSSGGIGGATILPNPATPNTNYPEAYNAPLGYGNGVQNFTTRSPYNTTQWFGNYTLVGGTKMVNFPSKYGSSKKYEFGSWSGGWPFGGTSVDAVTAQLGYWWNSTRPGDVINFQITHIPSGKVILSKDVVVES